MVKYIRREREGSKLEFYYNEFVKREWYKDKNLYDSRGKRIHYKVKGNQVEREVDEQSIREEEDQLRDKSSEGKKSVMLCVGEAASLIGMAPIQHTGARPKKLRSSLKNWPPRNKDNDGDTPSPPSLSRFPSRLALARVDEASKVPAAHFALEEEDEEEENDNY